MSRTSLPALLVVAVVAGAGGFWMGHSTADAGDGDVLPAEREEVARLVDERDELARRIERLERQRARMAAAPAPTGSPPHGSRSPAGGHPPRTARSGAEPEASARKASAETAKPDPEAAAKLMDRIRTALTAGDTDALGAMADELAIHGELMVSDLVSMLETSDSPFAMQNLAELLGTIGDERALPVLRDLLARAEDSGVRTAAVKALGEIPDAGSVPTLAAEFKRQSGSPMPPSLAATSLGKIGNEAAVAALRGEIEAGQNAMVRSFAMRALADLERPGLAGFFLDQAMRPGVSDRYRISAVNGAARTKNRDALFRLEKLAFGDGNPRALRDAAKRAINRISGRVVHQVD